LLKEEDINKIKGNLIDKIKIVEEDYLLNDLYPLLESTNLLESFKKSFKNDILKKIDYIL